MTSPKFRILGKKQQSVQKKNSRKERNIWWRGFSDFLSENFQSHLKAPFSGCLKHCRRQDFRSKRQRSRSIEWRQKACLPNTIEDEDYKKPFCGTSLPLASTRWVWLTLSSLYPRFCAVTSINLSNIKRKILGNAENQTQGCWVRSKCTVLCSPHWLQTTLRVREANQTRKWLNWVVVPTSVPVQLCKYFLPHWQPTTSNCLIGAFLVPFNGFVSA